ncbi:MAG: YqeG family HAD IIIA-type phosphatase [Bacillota bacterium]|nr:YqeG family HAD IIIA-type phosphatase [Bacillota bacterium]
MRRILYPKIYVDSLLSIPLEELQQTKIKAFIFDLDNTVTEWNSNQLRPEIVEWFGQLKENGFQACILSNNGAERVQKVAEQLDIPFIHRAQKPRRSAFYRAVELMQVEPDEVAVIGDQVFTDVLGGNRAGLYTILVRPLHRKEFLGTKFSRGMEVFVLHRMRKHLKNGSPYVQ